MRFVIIATILLFCAASGQAKVYKWTDPQGRVHYSAKPPPNTEASEVRIAPSPSTSKSTGQPEVVSQEEAEEPEKVSNANPDRQAALQRNCELARENMRILQDPSIRRFREDGQKEAVYYTDEQRQARIDQAQDMIERFCLEDGQD